MYTKNRFILLPVLQTILYTFPSLSELSDDEWIPAWKCEKMAVFLASPALPLRNPAPDLRLLQPGDWIQQDKGAPTPSTTLHHNIPN